MLTAEGGCLHMVRREWSVRSTTVAFIELTLGTGVSAPAPSF